MWDNADWANRHIQKKRKGTAQEAWEVVFEGDPLPLPMRSPEQLNFPPYIRYWTIGNKKGKTAICRLGKASGDHEFNNSI